jgi:hypothetical protein
MKIFFAASHLGVKNGFGKNYEKIYTLLEKMGHKHLSQIVWQYSTDPNFKSEELDPKKLFSQSVKGIKDSEAVVLEISTPSLSLGYLAAMAMEYNKPLIALHVPKSDLYILHGINSEKLIDAEYTIENLSHVLTDAMHFASDTMDTRFNFFVPPQISHYLDWITKYKKLPRAVFLRELIEEQMRSNKEYNSGK